MGITDTIKGMMGGSSHETSAGAPQGQQSGQNTGSNLTDRYGMGEGGNNNDLADQSTQRISDYKGEGAGVSGGEGWTSTRDSARDTSGGNYGASEMTGGGNNYNSGSDNMLSGSGATGRQDYSSAEAGNTAGVGAIGSGVGREESYGQGQQGSGQYGSGGDSYDRQEVQTGLSGQQQGGGHHHHHHGGGEEHQRDSGNSDGNVGMGALGEGGLKPGHRGHGGAGGGFDGAGEGYSDGNMGAGYASMDGDNSPISGTGNQSGGQSGGYQSSGNSYGSSTDQYSGGGRGERGDNYSGGDNYDSNNQQSGSFGADLTGAAGSGQRGSQQVAPGQFDESRNY